MTDIVVVGGGIVGLAVARSLTELHPDLTIKVLEKESCWGAHQPGHASGVIHSGIYCQPGSLKARLARAGNERLVRFCRDHGIAHEVCGKVIVATEEDEIPALDRLQERAKANGITVHRLSPAELHEREPHASGVDALYVPSSGIVDYAEVTRKLAALLIKSGVELHLNTQLEAIERSQGLIRLGTAKGMFTTRFLINCAGLHTDPVAEWDGQPDVNRVLPFRGDYFNLRPECSHLVRHLIYPVPDARFPFLGVHLTRSIHGGVHVGPNAVLSTPREGVTKTAFNFSETTEMLRSNGFWNFAKRHWRHGLPEATTAFSLRAFTQRLQRLVPEIRPEDLLPAESGVHTHAAQQETRMLEDLRVVVGRDSLHVCNAASPAATSSLELGRYIAHQAVQAEGFPVVLAPDDSWEDTAQNFCEGICET